MQSRVPSHGQVQQAVADVLARPEFADRPVSGIIAVLARLRAAAVDAVVRVLERLFQVTAGETILSFGVQFALALGALLLAGLLLFRIFRPVEFSGGTPRPSVALSGSDLTMDWSAAAESAARQGRYRQAAVALYQALLDVLERQGLVRLDPSKTPGDYRRELRQARVARGFDAFCRIFEPVAFGKAEPDRAAYERLSAAAAEAYGE